jgi:hypothetical protein
MTSLQVRTSEHLRHYATRREVPRSIPCTVLENFQVTYSFRPHSAAVGSTQPPTKMSTKEFPWGKVLPARTADNSAVLLVLSVKVMIETQHSTPHLNLHDLLTESFTLTSEK